MDSASRALTFIISGPPNILPVKMTNDSSVSQDDNDEGNDVEKDHAEKEVQKSLQAKLTQRFKKIYLWKTYLIGKPIKEILS